jgi:phospholipid/cholesterol/gamma-HCH transport system ATP-binding protein
MSELILRLTGIRKQYHGVRPLRLRSLSLARGERVAISGLDAPAAEVLVNLVTGASVPDEGTVEVCGRSTASIADGEDWLASLDRFGIVSPRAVLLDAATLQQNLAMPLTLQIDPVGPDTARRVEALAREVELDTATLDRPIASLDAAMRARAHLARAVALEPSLLILEHPTMGFAPGQAKPFGEVTARATAARGLATLIITEDAEFASAAADRRLVLNRATGELTAPVRGIRSLFSIRRRG